MPVHYMTDTCQVLCSWWINNVPEDDYASPNWNEVDCKECLANTDHREASSPRLNSIEVLRIMVGIDRE